MDQSQIAVVIAVVATVAVALLFLAKTILSPKKASSILHLIKQKKIPQAIKCAKQIIARDDKNVLAHYYLGKAYLLDNKKELALSEYKFVNQNAIFGEGINEKTFRSELAPLYVQFKQEGEALREYLLLTKLDLKNADVYFEIGKIYENQHRADLATNALRRALFLNKRHAKAHALLGLVLFRSKQFAEAKREIDTAIAISPETYSSYYYLGRILKENKDFGAAVRAFEKAQRDPEFKQRAVIERGTCFLLVGKMDAAIIDFERAIELDKENLNTETLHARYFLAAAFENLRKIDKALEQWEFIYKRSKNFRDVATKLNEYKDIKSNDSLKEYLTSGQNDFANICKKVALKMQLGVKVVENKKWGCRIIAEEANDEKWVNVRRQVSLLEFFRIENPIEDVLVREALDFMKKNNCQKCFLFSSSGFTHTASGFAEGRPVELIDRDSLEIKLKEAGV